MGSVRREDIEQAQSRIAVIAGKLEETGGIIIPGSEEIFV